MRKYGLIGYSLSHSWSKKYFENKFDNENISDAQYELYSINKIDELFTLIFSDKSIKGLNITIPYKEIIIPYLNEFSEEARAIGAVNTLKIEHFEDEVSIKAYNTDVFGFEETIIGKISGSVKTALILGSGGSAKAVAYVLKKHDISYTMVSRLKKGKSIIQYHEISEGSFENYDIIINCTPVGMYPNSGEMPNLPYHKLKPGQILYDLIYNPEKTQFLKEGEKRGCTTINGLKMLHLQAERSWEIWNSEE